MLFCVVIVYACLLSDVVIPWIVVQVLTGQAEMPADGGLVLNNNQANKLSCEVFVGNIPPETQSTTLQVRSRTSPSSNLADELSTQVPISYLSLTV